MNERLRKAKKILLNPYIITLVLFGVVFLFLDENNLLVTLQQKREVDKLHAEEETYRRAIADDSIRAEEMKNSLPMIEKFGRETYYLKGRDEDLFVVGGSETTDNAGSGD